MIRNRFIVPKIIYSLDLTPYERDLYFFYLSIAGEETFSVKQISNMLGISQTKIISLKKSLSKQKINGQPLIKIHEIFSEDGGRMPDLIEITLL